MIATEELGRENPENPENPDAGRGRWWIRGLIIALTLVVLGVLYGLLRVREARTISPPLAAEPKPVTVVPARTSSYREHRSYIGTLKPWVAVEIGPQMTSGYVQSVLVRPGARVEQGEVLATLDCRDAKATSKAVRHAAKALEAERAALAREAARMSALAEGEFISKNEVELKLARSEAEQARVLAEKSRLRATSLRVDDCVLRSPIAGEVVERRADPGSYAGPGDTLLVVIDRTIVRIEAHAPERDYDSLSPESPVGIHLFTGDDYINGRIARRSAAADPRTRTIHFEVDLDNSDHSLPVGTTARLEIDIGSEIPVIEVPLTAVSIRGSKATLFIVEDGRARRRKLPVIGERGDAVLLGLSLAEGTPVVSTGRSLLRDGDAVWLAAGEGEPLGRELSRERPPPAADEEAP